MAREPPPVCRQGAGVPHACGDGPGSAGKRCSVRGEFPTPVGMARRTRVSWRGNSGVPHACGDGPPNDPLRFAGLGVPHACGDGPRSVANRSTRLRSSPRLWGWPAGGRDRRRADAEFPTPVGMVRTWCGWSRRRSRVPHACGDGPAWEAIQARLSSSSPRLWGWPVPGPAVRRPRPEFPTPVGMARVLAAALEPFARVPHACGDGPSQRGPDGLKTPSSPRLWGWPDLLRRVLHAPGEFPTPVGMARESAKNRRTHPRVPHACGDGPAGIGLDLKSAGSSPCLGVRERDTATQAVQATTLTLTGWDMRTAWRRAGNSFV